MGEVIQLSTALQRFQNTAPAPRPATMLQPYQWVPLPAQLPPSVVEAALLLTNADGCPARAMSTDDLIEELFEPLAVVPMLLGHSRSLLAGDDLLVLATSVADMVQRHFPAFRVGEISLALRRGCAGEWKKEGEVLLPALPCIRSWLQAYHNGSRAAAIKALAAGHEQQKQLAAPSIDYPHEVAALAAWVTEHPFPEPLDQGNLLYTWLQQVGAFAGFKTPAQRWAMLRKEAIQQAGRYERRVLGVPSFAQQLRRGWPARHPLAATVTNNCRKRLLREWIRYHVARKTDLLTWLTDLSQQQISE